MKADPALLHLGVDLGAAADKIVLCDPPGVPLYMACAASGGSPLSSLRRILAEIPEKFRGPLAVKISVTGSGRPLLQGIPSFIPVNEVVAVALAVHKEFRQARTVIDLGGQLSKWILLAAEGDGNGMVTDFATNGLCAAGAGAFLEQQAGRLGVSLDVLGKMAAGAARAATVAGRCSVFAKSDMIHLQQKGTPPEEIALGLCNAMARTFCTTVLQGRKVKTPVVLVGGGAANPGLVRAFRDALALSDGELLAASDLLFWTARGAAMLAVAAPATSVDQFLIDLKSPGAAAFSGGGASDSCLLPLRMEASPGEPQPIEDPPPAAGAEEAYLGVDVGSVSTNLVLLSPDLRVLQGIYLPTEGRPVEALAEGLGFPAERHRHDALVFRMNGVPLVNDLADNLSLLRDIAWRGDQQFDRNCSVLANPLTA
jgi:predicted CoA-substrate-specific enzyme activase